MAEVEISDTEAIAKINDQIRKQIPIVSYPHKLVITSELAALPSEDLANIFSMIRNFDEFNEDNDPWKTRDFGKINYNGEDIFWKFDFFDKDMIHYDPAGQIRVLTLMYAWQY